MSLRSRNASVRDRTQEFLGIGESVRKLIILPNGSSSSGSKREDRPPSSVAMLSEFNRRASRIGMGIHQTSQKLAKLAKLAKRTSVFDDPASEIQELTAVVKQDITALNAAVVDLQVICNSYNGSHDISRDTTTHSTTIVDDLKNKLMSTTKEFKEVLTMRTENLKAHEQRRQLFTTSTPKNPSNPFVRQRPVAAKSSATNSSIPPLPWASDSQSSSSQLFPMNQVNMESQPLLQLQQSQQQQHLVSSQDSYIQSRAEALQNVESTILELGNIFNQLATLVSQQGELAIRIDENMDNTLTNVEGAQGALLRYLNSVSSNRWLMIKIFFVLVLFLMIFLFFVA